MSSVQVFYEATPNPDSMKFVVDRVIASETISFTTQESATRSPLAVKILGFPWAAGIMIGANFVTITKQNWVEWDIIADPLSDLIQEHIAGNQPVLLADDGIKSTGADEHPDDPAVVQQIKKVLREEIKPAVAMDGGDVSFSRYENGVVYLTMHGACAGCPSATFTLKEGIETRLKTAIPEIREVISI